MNVFELARVLAPLGGAFGCAMAVPRGVASTTSPWMWVTIPIGLAFGTCCYWSLIRLVIGKHEGNPDMADWRIGAVLGISCFAPCITGVLSYGLFRLLFQLMAS